MTDRDLEMGLEPEERDSVNNPTEGEEPVESLLSDLKARLRGNRLRLSNADARARPRPLLRHLTRRSLQRCPAFA